MSQIDEEWRQQILHRFEGREVLTKDELFTRYFESEGLPKDEVNECFELIEFEYDIPVGVLRPNDKLDKLIQPVTTKQPWRWLVYRTREGDSESELDYELGKRMRRAGNLKSWSHIKRFGDITFFDFLKAWCGLKP